jgi:hypothetical protein
VSFDAPHLPLNKYNIMAATEALTLVHERYQVTADGRKPKTMVYKLAEATQNSFTKPIELHGAKAVWIHVESNTAAELYIPSLLAELEANSATPTNNFDTADDGGYMKMSATFASDGTQERAGFGFDVVAPSSEGAGFIGGNCMPPMLSVKVTGADDKDVTIIVNY